MLVQNQIGGFQVSVHDVLASQVAKGVYQLAHEVAFHLEVVQTYKKMVRYLLAVCVI